MAALRASRLAWDIVKAFSFKTLPIRTPTGLKYAKYGAWTAGGQLFPQCSKSVFEASALNRSPGGKQM
jgi:hypothetical protein